MVNNADKAYLAVDMGASSGRHVLGLFDGRRLQLEEVYRFENGPVEVAGRLYWDLLGQWSHVRKGCGRPPPSTATESPASASIRGASISACWARGDELLGNPYHYRDSRTNGMMEKAFGIVSREEIFRHTGLQFMQFNTLYQLLAMKLSGSPLLDIAETLLMMPDLFHWLMTGVKCNEMTDASTSQFYNPVQGDWASELLDRFSLPTRILAKSPSPARRWGRCVPAWPPRAGWPAKVVLPGTHDTASAVAAVPAHSQPGAAARLVLHQPGHLGLDGRRVAAAGDQRRGAEAQLHQRRRRRRHDPAAEEHHRPVAGAGMPPDVEPAGANLDWEALNRLSAAAAAAVERLSIPTPPSSWPPATCPRRFATSAAGPGQPVPEDEGRRAALRLESIAMKFRHVLGMCEEIGGRTDRDDPHRRRRHEEPPALPVRGRRLRPPRGGRSGRGHGDRQPDDAGRGRRRRGLDCRGPRGDPPQLPGR